MTTKSAVRERAYADGVRAMSDRDLLEVITGSVIDSGVNELAWLPAGELRQHGLTERSAAILAAAFELGRRGAWAPPKRGERCLSPKAVHDLMRRAAYAEKEGFYMILLDVRGRLMRVVQTAEGSLSQCPVSVRDALRPAVREGAHGVVFVHNHPSGDPGPSQDDEALTQRLRAAADLLGVTARDHVIVAGEQFFSFVEAGRWR